MTNSWEPIPEWDLDKFSSAFHRTVENTALLDDAGEVVAVGRLYARGLNNHWLMEPANGGTFQYVQGTPALGGYVGQRFTEGYLEYQPASERLKAAKELLDDMPQRDGLGFYERFTKCGKCPGYRLRQVFISQEGDFDTSEGVYYLQGAFAEAFIAFLRPELCHGH
jgi:hypothetical protein